MDIFGSLLSTLAGQGIIGIVLATSLFLNWYQIRQLQSVNDKRVTDAKELSDKILEPISAIKQNSDLLITLFTRFLNGNDTNK